MKGILYKDVYLLKGKLIANLICLVVVVIFADVSAYLLMNSPDAPSSIGKELIDLLAFIVDFTIAMFMGVLMYDLIMKIDNGKNWGYYGISCPKGEKGIVGGKYLLVLIMHAAPFVICVINDGLLGLLTGKKTQMAILVAFFLLVRIMINAIEMPLVFRFGDDKANHIRILISVIIFSIAAIYFLFGNIEWLMGENGLFNMIKGSMSGAPGAIDDISRMLEKTGNIVVIITVICATIGTCFWYFISFLISCAVFKKGISTTDAMR
ncbi:MAG: ABC-2 transporter permease [Eubacterium sp.]|nr:ABC-2 transporter permease [Eubacterium sp.]